MYPREHPYHHTVIGSMEDLDGASLEDVESFFRTYYVPNNAVLTVAGDIDAAETLDLVDRYFGEIPAGAALPPIPGRTDLDPALGSTVRDHVVSDVPLPRLIMAFRIPPYSSEDFARRRGVARPARDGARLEALPAARQGAPDREERRDVRVSRCSPVRRCSSPGRPGIPRRTWGSSSARWATSSRGLGTADDAEVERAIALAETDLLRALERVAGRADLLSMFELYFDDPGRINRELDRLRAVTVDQIRSFAADVLGPDNRAVLTYVPESGS